MRHFMSASSLAGVFLLGAQVAVSAQEAGETNLIVDKLERENRQLQRQLETLRESYQKSLAREETKTKALADLKKNLAIFGQDFFDNGDDKLRRAVADYQISREKYDSLEEASINLSATIQDYLRNALIADPQKRADVETRLRELEAALGYREKPQRQVRRGTPQNASIVSIDSNTGVAVINVGSKDGTSTGMGFDIERAGQKIADATVAIVRDNTSGLFLNTISDSSNPVRPGDIVRVITINNQSQP